jgi:hypothetical protein
MREHALQMRYKAELWRQENRLIVKVNALWFDLTIHWVSTSGHDFENVHPDKTLIQID